MLPVARHVSVSVILDIGACRLSQRYEGGTHWRIREKLLHKKDLGERDARSKDGYNRHGQINLGRNV